MYFLEFAGQDDTFAAAEAENAATDIRILATGIGVAKSINPNRLRGLAYTRRASDLLIQTAADIDQAATHLRDRPIERTGTVAVRARDVRGSTGIDTQAAERTLGSVLTDRGCPIDLDNPDHELRVCFADDVCAIGWERIESDRGYGDRSPTDRPFFQPGAMEPIEARALANLVKAQPGMTVLDPMCGTGGLLIEAALLGARVLGSDAQRHMVRGSRSNFEAAIGRVPNLVLADATALPFRGASIDAILFDVPYGRQSRIEGSSATDLILETLQETQELADRGVVVANRSLTDDLSRTNWQQVRHFTRRVHRSLTRHVHVLRVRD